MKKYISLLLAVLMITSCISVLPVLAESFSIGDANLDGKVNVKDATHIQRYVASIITFSEEELSFADVNADDKVNIKDVTMIQKFIAKLIEGFPSDNAPENVTTEPTDDVTESVNNSEIGTDTYEPTAVTSVESESTIPEETKPADSGDTKPAEPENTKPVEPEVTKPSVDVDGFNNQIVRP